MESEWPNIFYLMALAGAWAKHRYDFKKNGNGKCSEIKRIEKVEDDIMGIKDELNKDIFPIVREIPKEIKEIKDSQKSFNDKLDEMPQKISEQLLTAKQLFTQ